MKVLQGQEWTTIEDKKRTCRFLSGETMRIIKQVLQSLGHRKQFRFNP